MHGQRSLRQSVLVYRVDSSAPNGMGGIRVNPTHPGGNEQCGPLAFVPFDVGPGEISSFHDPDRGVTLEVLEAAGDSYRVRLSASHIYTDSPPDRDGDGAPDSSDQCPDRQATTADGCPRLNPPLSTRRRQLSARSAPRGSASRRSSGAASSALLLPPRPAACDARSSRIRSSAWLGWCAWAQRARTVTRAGPVRLKVSLSTRGQAAAESQSPGHVDAAGDR